MPQRVQCSITQVIDHGERVYSVFLKPDSVAPRFRPGQFLHLALDSYTPGDFWPESRVFSIASSSEDRNGLRLTYAVKGQFTTRMESEIQVGGRVWVKLPYGEFIINPERDACLLAGGTGMTAFTAFLGGLQADYPRDVYLFYGARCPELLIFRSLVEETRQRCSHLHASYMVEQGNSSSDYTLGRIDLDLVFKSLSNPLLVTYYLAGPPEMLDALTRGLEARGVQKNQILIDAWE
ncbi:MAG TPA: FAD-dependent oxidoreductase [Anaerolineales bacterium]|nr:FAD-dependent oxidoreductase [Anaerolineales bacterium]